MNPSVSSEPTASCSRNVYARSPAASHGEPVFLSAGNPEARNDETNEDTRSLKNPEPRFDGKVPTVNLPMFQGAYPQNSMVEQPNNHISDLHFDKSPPPYSFPGWWTSFKTEVCSGSIYTSETMRWVEKSRRLRLRTILRHRSQFLDINTQTLRCLMQGSLPPCRRS